MQNLIISERSYDPNFQGGVFAAAGDLNGDGKADIVTGPGAGGGPFVNVFNPVDQSRLASIVAYAPFQQPGLWLGGVRVGVADLNGDGRLDLLTGAGGGAGGGPDVHGFDGGSQTKLLSFFAYDQAFQGGVFVAGR